MCLFMFLLGTVVAVLAGDAAVQADEDPAVNDFVIRRTVEGGIAAILHSDLVVAMDGQVSVRGHGGERAIRVDPLQVEWWVEQIVSLDFWRIENEPTGVAPTHVADGMSTRIEVADGKRRHLVSVYALNEAPASWPEMLHRIDRLLSTVVAAVKHGHDSVVGVRAAREMPENKHAKVRATLHVDRTGVIRLCDGLLESYPPKCPAGGLIVEGLPPEVIEGLEHHSGVRWSEGPFVVSGRVREGVLADTILLSRVPN